MPRYARRKSKMPRNKMYRRRYRRIPRAPSQYTFTRTTRLADITASVNNLGVGTNIAQAYQFNLNQLPNVSEFTTLFDQYKIKSVKLTLVPSGSEALISPLSGVSTAFGFNRVLTAIDYDDATAPSSENDMLQYQSLKITKPMATHTRYLSPKVLAALYQSITSTSYESRKAPWIDVGNPSVPHYGVKVWVGAPVPNLGTPASITYTVYLKMTFCCKNVR